MTGRNRHIQIKEKFVQHLVASGRVRFQHIPREFNWADIMVKALDKKNHRSFVYHIMGPHMHIEINYTDAERLARTNKKRSLE